MRTREGMKVAKAKGRLRGQQPKLSPMQEAHLVKLYRAGEHTVSELEEHFPVTRSTISRAVPRAGGPTAPVTAAIDPAAQPQGNAHLPACDHHGSGPGPTSSSGDARLHVG